MAPNGVKEKGSQSPAVATLGDWRPLAYLGYVDLTQDVDRGPPNLLAETDPLGADEEKVHLWVKGPAGGLRSINGFYGAASNPGIL